MMYGAIGFRDMIALVRLFLVVNKVRLLLCLRATIILGIVFCNKGPSCSYKSGTTDCRSQGVSASSCSGYHSYNCYAQYSNNKAEADSIYCITHPTDYTRCPAILALGLSTVSQTTK